MLPWSSTRRLIISGVSPRSVQERSSMTMIRLRMRDVGAWALALALSFPIMVLAAGTDYEARVAHVLKQTPLIDGHNDLPWEIRERFKSQLAAFDLKSDTPKLTPPPDSSPLMTDIPRLRAGGVGGQFWSVWVPVSFKGFEAVQTTLEQIDLVKRLAAHYPADL